MFGTQDLDAVANGKTIARLIYIYIYKTETFEALTIFHVSTIFKLNLN